MIKKVDVSPGLSAQKPIDIAVLSLHTHWITADAIKVRISLDVSRDNKISDELNDLGQLRSKMQTMVVFYALFYVVIEGYRELKLKDENIDALLSTENYEDLLRRFRNAIFHFQRNPFDQRLIDFLNAKDSENWIREIYAAFEKFFLKELPIKQTLERLGAKGGLPSGIS